VKLHKKDGMHIAAVGLWHQGAVAAACLAELGHDVVGADHDAERIEHLSAGRAPLYEPGLDELLQDMLHSGRLRFTADVASAVRGRPFVLLAFDTPVDDEDRTDLSEVFETVKKIAPHLEPETVVWVTAQVPVGTCDTLAEMIRDTNPSVRIRLAYSPENLRLGQAIERFRNPPLPVLGADEEETLDRLEGLLSALPVRWQRVSLRTAEMVKHALNSFLATTITLGNEIGNLCDEVGADGKRVAEVLRLEPRVGPKAMLFPGLGFSGGTLARDLQALRRLGDEVELDTYLLDGVWTANQSQNGLVLRKLRKAFGDLAGRRVTVLGLTYKPDTSTLRRSAALDVIADLVRNNVRVSAHDPRADREELARHREFAFHENVYDAIRGAEALVIMTPWPEYRNLDFKKVHEMMSRALVVDAHNMLDAEALTAMGYTYLDVGRGRQPQSGPGKARS